MTSADFSPWEQESAEWAEVTEALFDEWLEQSERVEVIHEDSDRLS